MGRPLQALNFIKNVVRGRAEGYLVCMSNWPATRRSGAARQKAAGRS
jgi:hypothetical protein